MNPRLKAAPSYRSELMRSARTIASLQRRARTLRAELKRVQAELRHERKVLSKLAAARDVPWDEQGAASKVLGSKAGE